jgi:hypothetical protein
MDPIKKQARFAGVLYTLDALIAPISLFYVPNHLAGGFDAGVLRLGLVSELFYQTLEIFLALAVYNLFVGVNRSLARVMIALCLAPTGLVFANSLNWAAALLTGQNDPNLTQLFLHLHHAGLDVASIFWGLWLFPFGLLIIRSGFIPKAIGFSSIVGGAGYTLSAIGALAFPGVDLLGQIAPVLEIGELPAILWLLIMGAKSVSAPAN